MTNLPSNGDYVQALQHPEACFHDHELKAGQVQLTPLGMPKAISGNFASVFSVTGASGKRYAVKCFTRQVHGQHQRYQAIHDALAGLARPWQVGFEYIGQGVLVDGQWHAILRMEWVENSKTLIPWIEQNLGSRDRILNVAKQFAECIGDMRSLDLAHGDLQHGNLLIDDRDRLRVIDYDGMFVPSIKNLGSNEIGLANYQHPLRSGGDFGPHLDRFSAWLIYSSLLLVSANPGLWSAFHKDGDEKLLFGREDFVPPFDTIKRIATLGSPHAEIASLLTELLASSKPLEEVPEFEPERLAHPSYTAAPPPTTMSSDWWRQVIPDPSNNAAVPDQTVPGRLGTSWLRSHEAPLPPLQIIGPSRASKILALIMTAIAVLVAVAIGTAANLLAGGLVGLFWVVVMTTSAALQWRRSAVRLERADARLQLKHANQELSTRQKQLAAARSARTDLDAKERKEIQVLENERAKLGKSSTAEYERLSKSLRKKIESLRAELARVDALKATEARRQLQETQDLHIRTYMAARRIQPGVIPGIGPAMVASLSVHGIRTAADIAGINGNQFRTTGSSSWFTIRGIGPSKSFDIKYWHQNQLSAAQAGAPQSLPPQQSQALNAKFANQKVQHQAAIDATDSQLRQIKATVDAKYSGLDQEISVKIEAVRLDYQSKRAAGDATISQADRELQQSQGALLDTERNLARFQSVTFSNYLKS